MNLGQSTGRNLLKAKRRCAALPNALNWWSVTEKGTMAWNYVQDGERQDPIEKPELEDLVSQGRKE